MRLKNSSHSGFFLAPVLAFLFFCLACESSPVSRLDSAPVERGTVWGNLTRNDKLHTTVHTFLVVPGDLDQAGHDLVDVDYKDILDTALSGLQKNFQARYTVADHGILQVDSLKAGDTMGFSVYDVLKPWLKAHRPEISSIYQRISDNFTITLKPGVNPADFPGGPPFDSHHFQVGLAPEAGEEVMIAFCYMPDRSAGSVGDIGIWPRGTPFTLAEVPVLGAEYPEQGFVPPFKVVLAAAHELGHALLGLIDSYGTPLNGDALDIMSVRNWADPAILTTPYTRWNRGDPAGAVPPAAAWARLIWGYAGNTTPGFTPNDTIIGFSDILVRDYRDPQIDFSIPANGWVPAYPFTGDRAALPPFYVESRIRGYDPQKGQFWVMESPEISSRVVVADQ